VRAQLACANVNQQMINYLFSGQKFIPNTIYQPPDKHDIAEHKIENSQLEQPNCYDRG